MKKLMILGTASSVGKSIMVAGILRALSNRGLRVAPFKSQNMSRFSKKIDGLEMSLAQAFQAKAARQRPHVDMNPILLKPKTDNGSEVILRGQKIGEMDARTYFKEKERLMPLVLDAFESLGSIADIVIIEGAGSPAEINLRSMDIVNLGLADAIGANALLVGDVDRGGVFASLFGTYFILPERDRRHIKGFIINKFRGDVSLLMPGVESISQMTGLKSYGVMPYLRDMLVDDEDSAGDKKLGEKRMADYPKEQHERLLDDEFNRLADAVEKNLDVDGLLELLS
ncbi:MAG: cobyric acid synthase [Bacillota bacterium]|nr:cobyric acid synthase [Bacillota bacterium]